ncbi:MAG TPA: hypothetical protein VGM69_06455 [Chloroflexota bacterium]|jgi:hypothetical protein
MFLFVLGFFFGWIACSWYVENGRSFDRAFGPLAHGAGEALGEATRVAREMTGETANGGRGGTPSASRRTRRTGSA